MKYFSLICLICLSACGSTETKENLLYPQMEKYLIKIGKDFSKIKVVYMIPKQGCHTCVEKAVTFSGNYANKNEILFLAVGFGNKKEIRLLYGKQFVEQKNIYIDFNKEFSKYDSLKFEALQTYHINHKTKFIKKYMITPNNQENIQFKIREGIFSND